MSTVVVIGRQTSGSSRSNDNNNSDNKRKTNAIEDVLKFKLSPGDYLYVFSPKSVRTESIGRREKREKEREGERESHRVNRMLSHFNRYHHKSAQSARKRVSIIS